LIILNLAIQRAVNWDLLKVSTKTMAMGVRVREDSGLQNSVHRKFDAGADVSWVEGYLLHFGKEVCGVAIEHKFSNWNERVITMGPNLCNISHIIPIVSCFSLRDSLNVESPACRFTTS
jgi:hypothetical protein